MLDPMFHIWNKGCILKTIAKEPPKSKIWLSITILEMTLSSIYGLKKATMQSKIKKLIYSKNLVNTHFLVLSICLLTTYQSLTWFIS